MDGYASVGETWFGRLLADESLGVTHKDVPAGGVLYEPEQRAEHFYLVTAGEVRLYQPGPDGVAGRLLEILGTGDWLGVASLGHQNLYERRAVAVTASQIAVVPAAGLLRALSRHGDAAVGIIQQIASRLQDAYGAAGLLVFDDCPSRLTKQLLRFSRSAAAQDLGDGVVSLRITHEQLAQAVGAARETVSLCLTELRHRNLVRTGRNRLIYSPDALRQALATALAAVTSDMAPAPSEPAAAPVTRVPVGLVPDAAFIVQGSFAVAG